MNSLSLNSPVVSRTRNRFIQSLAFSLLRQVLSIMFIFLRLLANMELMFCFVFCPVSMLPSPPPLPPGAMPPPPSFPLSFPLRSLEPPGMMLLPPLFSDTACDKPEAANHVSGSVCRALDIEGPVVEEAGSSKESSSIHCDESSSPHNKAELGSLSDTDPEDDIKLPENDNYSSQPFNYGSGQVPVVYLNTEQPLKLILSTPVSKSYAEIQQDIDDGSRQASSSPYSERANIVPKCGLHDLYDPFLDSFEPASAKPDCVQEQEPVRDSYTVPKPSVSSNKPLSLKENNQGDDDKQAPSGSNITAGVSVSSNKPPNVEENTTGNDIGAVVSEDNNKFVEREGNSQETVAPRANNNVREGVSTRKKSQGDSKEKDSSRSKKLFKVVLTNFVKDLLKPSWRQGNMSKEAFKTIVKRAVDKVSSSMEGRRVPKSRAKIDKYIDSSQHKLTKLLMGYIDKYVKG